jgi:protein-S-isoprenylcysteine O-methyltransferase Ste14
MYLSTGEVIGMSIALASAIVLIVLTTIANYQIQQENKFIRARLKEQRQYCKDVHVKVPF